MLAAVYRGKAGNITVDGEKKSWRTLFSIHEDLLTAVFFGRFLYLSPEMRPKALAYIHDAG